MRLAAITTTILLILTTALSPPASSSSSPPFSTPAQAPEIADECLTKLMNLSDCLTYVEQGSSLKAPHASCCSELAGLMKNSPICLCEMLGKADSYGFKIDLQRATHLPSACRMTAPPPASLCSAMGYPVLAPSSSKTSPVASPIVSIVNKASKTALAGLAAPSLFVVIAFATLF